MPEADRSVSTTATFNDGEAYDRLAATGVRYPRLGTPVTFRQALAINLAWLAWGGLCFLLGSWIG